MTRLKRIYIKKRREIKIFICLSYVFANFIFFSVYLYFKFSFLFSENKLISQLLDYLLLNYEDTEI